MSHENDTDKGFLSRWSKRKLDHETQVENKPQQSAEVSEKPEQAQPDMPQDDAQKSDLPIWQRDDVDAETKKAALRKLFSKPEFNVRDGLNEYDDDFTKFAGLGNIVTHEMKRMLKLAEEKTRPSAGEAGKQAAEDKDKTGQDDDKEDKDLA